MASVRNIGLPNEDKIAQNERNPPCAMSVENSSNTLNKTPPRDSYWFAHGGIEDVLTKNAQTSKSTGTGDPKDAQLQKDKAERIRMFHEQQEEDRVKKLKDLEQQFLQAKKHREQQEEERKRRIEEARIKEIERRQQVEERKRQIWEAEQERKEAILRRNMEREARIEARRNAQRNSQCFAFGSSTPRTFDLDLAAIGAGRNTSPGLVLMSSVSGRRSEERDLGPPRATSACSLDRKFGEDCMSRSMVSLSSSSAFRGRKRTDILPTLTRERSVTPHVTPRGNCMRAVSMTRLDQLAQPRRPYRDLRTLYPNTTITNNGGPRALSPSMTKSMVNLAAMPQSSRRMHVPMASSRRGNMSQSMLHLADSPQRDTRGLTPSPTVPKSGMRSAQSMMHLAAAPRLTRTARLRADALAKSRAASAWNLNNPDAAPMSRHYLSPGKDASRSPSRPQSSMSGASEISATSSSISAVNMRARSAPRRPRPYSIAGSSTERTPIVPSTVKKEPERQPRLTDKNAQPAAPKPPPRVKSITREKSEEISRPKKPVPPPKSKEVLARARSNPVPTKDNLRKTVKANTHDDAKTNDKSNENIENINIEDKENMQNMVVKSPAESKSEPIVEIINSSPVTSPVTDSEMCISSEDSRIMTESDMNSYNQTFTDPEAKTEVYKSVNITAAEKQHGVEEAVVKESENIPQIAEQEKSVCFSNTQVVAAQNDVGVSDKPAIAEQKNVSSSDNLVITEQKNVNGVSDNSATDEQKSVGVIDNPAISLQKNVGLSNNIVIAEQTVSESENGVVKEVIQQKPRITSEEEARAALAEKRRIAREKAEREAELERQRQEEIRRKEEEQRLLEEQEQKRMEEEQIRLAELHRQLEAEKLRKAIEEQKQREKEEQDLKEEEARQKVEKEEQERKAREEAEKQRLELEERLRKEEEERAERKRRVEQIMARTRGKSAAQSPASTPNDNGSKSIKMDATTPNSTVEKLKSSILSPAQDLLTKANHILNGSRVENSSLSTSFTSNSVSSNNPFETLGEVDMSRSMPLPDLLNNDVIANHSAKSNGHHEESSEEMLSSKISTSNSFSSNRTLSANDALSPTQTNGYSSHEDMSCTTSPEETSDAGLLIDVGNSPQHEAKNTAVDPTDFTRLVEIDQSPLNLNENYLISVDKVNSNILSTEKSFTGFEERLQKTDAAVVDLLS